MKQANKNIEGVIKKISFRAGPELDKNLWTETLRTHSEFNTTVLTLSKNNIWRIIMKNPATKFAAAAVIVLAVILVLVPFGKSIDPASAAWAKVLESTNKMPWIRINFTNLIDSNSLGFAKTGERWLNAASKIDAVKSDVGIDYADCNNMIRYTYYPQKNELLINIIPDLPGMFYEGFQTNSDFLEACYRISSNSENRKVEKSDGEYQGKKVVIYTINKNIYALTGNFYATNENEKFTLISIHKTEVYVDPKTNLIISIFHKSIEPSSGKLKQDMISIFSYPEKGPQSIYDLGVPKDVRMVDKTYQPLIILQ
jgi:hypothetical protein